MLNESIRNQGYLDGLEDKFDPPTDREMRGFYLAGWQARLERQLAMALPSMRPAHGGEAGGRP
jgi:hypothetical protein